MSLEDALHRVANAVAAGEASVAVREIIRQRDQALKDLATMTTDRDYYLERRDSIFKKLETERHRAAALRGVIVHMKKCAHAPARRSQ